MQHIPVVSHALWRGTFILKMLDVVPTIQTTGSYHRQDLCLFTAGGASQGWEVGGGVSSTEAEVPFQWRRMFQRALEWCLLPYRDSCAGLCWPYLGQCIRESLRGGRVNSGSSVHSVGRAKVVPHPLNWWNGASSVCVPFTPTPQFHPSWTRVQAARLPRALTNRWTAT